MVARMCDILDLGPGDRVLEIGTGCGYHAAVVAELGCRLHSVEYHPALAERARARLSRLGYDVAVRTGDGREGWPEAAPYDAAYLTCAAERFPASVLEQVTPGGRVLGPIGTGRQRLVEGRVGADGTVERVDHGGVRFVPLL
jgi:protein-L-isoaspartate(D-aspartate) O-methyltransferase